MSTMNEIFVLMGEDSGELDVLDYHKTWIVGMFKSEENAEKMADMLRKNKAHIGLGYNIEKVTTICDAPNTVWKKYHLISEWEMVTDDNKESSQRLVGIYNTYEEAAEKMRSMYDTRFETKTLRINRLSSTYYIKEVTE